MNVTCYQECTDIFMLSLGLYRIICLSDITLNYHNPLCYWNHKAIIKVYALNYFLKSTVSTANLTTTITSKILTWSYPSPNPNLIACSHSIYFKGHISYFQNYNETAALHAVSKKFWLLDVTLLNKIMFSKKLLANLCSFCDITLYYNSSI